MKRFYLFLVLFLFLFSLGAPLVMGQSSKTIPQDFCISQKEYQLYSLINTYRSKLMLDPIPLSASLCYVAHLHASDLAKHYNPKGDCNMRSWSGKTTGKAFCYPKDQAKKKDVNDKAKEISNYPGKAWEITYWGNTNDDLQSILAFWNDIPYAADMISNSQKWKDDKWNSMGVAIQEGYVLLWLGKKETIGGSQIMICETGEKIGLSPKDTDAKAKKYYIIIGSYKSMSDAQSAQKSYKEMGYSRVAALESGGRFRLSIDSFSSSNEADKALKKYNKKFQGAWIFSN
ncbi:MAG: hypothetical protein B7C24_11890 [Bacteroidetes bacterium 4572_77]|nr:MAG: hypothetical protein B7C24_11890 [Bacteroidetes bacterium 4572_77]